MKTILLVLLFISVTFQSFALTNDQVTLLSKAGLTAYAITNISQDRPSDSVVNCTYQLSAYVLEGGLSPFYGYNSCRTQRDPDAYVVCVKGRMKTGFNSPSAARFCL